MIPLKITSKKKTEKKLRKVACEIKKKKKVSSGRKYTPSSRIESEVAQSCLTLCNPIDCSLPGSFIHEIFQARLMEWVAFSFSRGIFLTQGSNPDLLHCRQIIYDLSHQGNVSNRISICIKHFRGTY